MGDGGFDDDTALVDALRLGDEQAFAWLLDRYDASLRREPLMQAFREVALARGDS